MRIRRSHVAGSAGWSSGSVSVWAPQRWRSPGTGCWPAPARRPHRHRSRWPLRPRPSSRLPPSRSPTGRPTAAWVAPGSDPAAVVLAAQQAATLTPEGAAGFALAFLRYQGTSPGDLQLSTTLPRIVHPGWLPEVSGPFAKHSADLAALGGVSGTVPGAADTWRIVAADPAGASISVGFVIYLGQHSAPNMVQSTGVLILDVTDGHWVVAGAAPPPPSD